MKKKIVSITILLMVLNAFLLAVSIKPVAAYGKDAHHDMTYSYAKTVGFSGEDANKIASADQAVDTNSETDGWTEGWIPYGDKEELKEWHACEDPDDPGYRNRRLNELRQQAIGPPKDLVKLGQYLHFLEDYYAHKYVTASWIGHALDTITGNDPDSPATCLENYREMSYQKLAELYWFKQNVFKESISGILSIEDVINEVVAASDPTWKAWGWPWGPGQKKDYETVTTEIREIWEEYLGEEIPDPIPYEFDENGTLIGIGDRYGDLYVTELQVPAYSVEGKWIEISFIVGNKGLNSSPTFQIIYGLWDAVNWNWTGIHSLIEDTLSPGQTISRKLKIEGYIFDIGQPICVAVINPMPEIDSTNDFAFVLVKPPPDVALINVTLSKTVVGQGYATNVNVTVANQGNCTEAFHVEVYANMTSIISQSVTLTSGNLTTITFTCNTSGFVKGNYTIWAYAWPVQGETDTTDNALSDGWVVITIPGDVNGDTYVNIKDAVLLGVAFGSEEGQPMYNPNADINGDGYTNIKDAVILGVNFGQQDP